MKENQETLKRTIGIWGLSANIVNSVLGAGIFVIPAIVATGLGSASIFAYLFCGLLVALVMLCFAEVGSKITHPGGAYAYIEESFGKAAGFVTAIIFVISANSGDAAVANALVDIIGSFFPLFQNNTVKIFFFLLLFSGLAYINIRGVKEGIRFVMTLTLMKIIPLLAIVFIGFKDIDITNLYWDQIPSLKELGEVSLILFFAFQGAETGLSISGEVKNPQKTVPGAIFIGILGVLTLYILLQTVSQGVLGSSLATFKENPLGETAKSIFGPVGLTLITIGAGVSMFGLLSSDIFSMPRVLYSAAQDKVIPIEKLASVHKKFLTPHFAIIVYAVVGFIFASSGSFRQLAILSSSATLTIYLGVALAAIKLRWKKIVGTGKETFKIPGGYTVPVLAVFIILYFLSNLARKEMITAVISIACLIVIFFIIQLLRNKQSKTKS